MTSAQTGPSELSYSQQEPWRSLRSAALDLKEQACEGSSSAIQQIRERLASGDPIIAGTLRDLRMRCGVLLDLPLPDVIEYERRAADLGYPLAVGRIGERLVRGNLGLDQDIDRGLDELDRAASNGNVDAMFVLVRIWSDGDTVDPDFERAIGQAYVILDLAQKAGDDALALETAAFIQSLQTQIQLAAERAIEQEQTRALEAASTRENLFEGMSAVGKRNPKLVLSDLDALSNGNTPNPSRMQQRRFDRSFD